ncbi:MAG: hypothetical protein HOP29_15965 [Phycisphaerales bacterium]|nr:hypothetical protein [Phycisphaerales bacterium]
MASIVAWALVGVGMTLANRPTLAQCGESQRLTASATAADDHFGESVAVSGDTAVVGAWFDDHAGGESGSAYVYLRTAGVWSEHQKLTAADAAANDHFGYSVSVSADTIVVGAWHDDDAGDNSGSAYVFVKSGGLWIQQQKLTASDAAPGDDFGVSVSVSANTAVIGAWHDDDAGPSSGSAYVFVRSGGVWTQQRKLIADDAAAGDDFGVSVSVRGDTAVVGAWHDDDAALNSGSAYVFARSGGLWTQQQKLTSSDAAAGDNFGVSASLSGDTAVIGAWQHDHAGDNSGAAYVFVRSGGLWIQQQKLTAPDAAAGDNFGISLSVRGDTAVVGAWRDDDAAPTSGSAHVFVRSGGTWTQRQKLTASNAAAGEAFGVSVSAGGDTVVIGTGDTANPGASRTGSAYVFTCTPMVIHVDAGASGANDGSSWTDAHTSLQDALAHALVVGRHAEIWVAAETYTPDRGTRIAPANRTATFQLLNGVTIYGGFAGNETALSQRDVNANVTILSGEPFGDDSPVACTQNSADCDSFGGLCSNGFCITPGNNAGNSYHVVTGSGTDATAILDGFTITAGNANGAPPNDGGAGMYNDAGSPTVVRCTFTGNSAVNGGGMRNVNNSSPTVTDCTFLGNHASDGGGVNVAFNSNPTITNCTFTGNSADFGGGLSVQSAGAPILTNCTFAGNSAVVFGGAIANHNGAPLVTNGILWGNSDPGGTDESAQIHSVGGAPVVDYSIVQGGWTGAGGTANGSADPLFFDPDGVDGIVGTADDDLRPIGGSPAVDSGNNLAVPMDVADLDGDGDTAERTPLDLAGKPRFVDDLGTSDSGVDDPPGYPRVVDMGAYEYFPDCNHNAVADDIDIISGTSLDANGDDVPDECAMWNPPPVNDGFWGTAGNWLPPIVPDNDMDDVFDVIIRGPDELVTLNIDAEINSLKLLDDATLYVTQGGLSVLTPAAIVVDGLLLVTGTHSLNSVGPVVVDDSPDLLALGGCIPPPTVSLRGSGSHSMSSLTVQECAQVLAGDSVTTRVSGPVYVGPGGFYGPDPDRIDPSAAELSCAELNITGNEFAAGVFELDDTMTLTVNGDVNLIAGGQGPSEPTARLLGGCIPPPTLRARGFASLTITGSLNVSECAEVSIGPNVTVGAASPGDLEAGDDATVVAGGSVPPPSVELHGNLVNAQTAPDRFNWRFGALVLSGGQSHRIEAAGHDRGASPIGFTHNYTIGRLDLKPASTTTVVDEHFNGSGGEAMYVGELVLQSQSTLTLETPLYAGRVINNGGTIQGPGQLQTIVCVTDNHCDDGTACTSDECVGGDCTYAFALFGDVNTDGAVDMYDILCVLDGFAGVFTTCSQPSVDLAPCPTGDELIDIFDVLAVMDGFRGSGGCCSP